MAKKFYSLEEAADKLDMSTEQVKELAKEKKLEQFRNGDKLMFKVEQVDAVAGGSKAGSGGPIDLADSGESDAIKLSEDSAASKADSLSLADDTDVADAIEPATGKTHLGKPAGRSKEDPKQATGVSVFDADEIEAAEPNAQTQVTTPASTADEELALESVGSGSGLLDLTRESDDTSLGAELLDEIYPGGGEGSDSKTDGSNTGSGTAGATATGASAQGSSGVFEGAITMESGPSGLENIQNDAEMGTGLVDVPVMEAADPAWSGFGTGTLLGVAASLCVGLIVAMSAVMDIRSPFTRALSESSTNLLMLCGGLLVGSFILGAVGFFIG
ncbi:MAG: hypothetical protein NTW19_12615, partial [Planctomycetota bacterium]|nr:hypothetical protein [Planctomycetota bacterium]